MKIATWNVNSIGVRLPHVLKWLDDNNPDILCLQEIKTVEERFPYAELRRAGYSCQVYGQPTYNGVAIASKEEAQDVVRGFEGDAASEQRRVIAARFGSVTVINLYVPNGSEVGSDRFAFKISWLARLKAYLVARYEPTDKLVLCGDFNVALEDRDVYDPGELAGSILFSEQEKEAASALMEFGFSDVFRRHVEEPGHYSWWDYRQGAFRRNLGLRIDHLWATSPVAERSISCWIDRETRKLPRPSDHAPVVGVFDLRSATWEQTLLAL